MELMAGKILGQLGVGLSILVIYGAVGGGALVIFGLGYLLGVMNLIYLLVFFLIGYFTVGAMLAAIGSAVNDLREAQSLQTPVMLVMMIPYLMWFLISRDPNGLVPTVMSFIPPLNSFVMILRVTARTPPPLWQVVVSIAIGIAGVYGAFWAAAKIFRIGLLMFGKPPDFRTLVRWVRMA
jgi:ABC-type Na+ efflux pump permease subunit